MSCHSDSLASDGELASSKTMFSLKFNSAVWFFTAGLQFIVGWWYRKAAVFYLPPGWFGPLTWWLAFPFAPAGSVSCGVWQMACRRVIKVGEKVVKEFMSENIGEQKLSLCCGCNGIKNRLDVDMWRRRAICVRSRSVIWTRR